jgi:uncharacterized membrane protein YhhN
MTVTLLVLTAAVAVGDWAAVSRRLVHAELLLKPLTLALLIAAAATADLGSAKPWVLAALAFGLVGDIGLMLSRDDAAVPDGPFLVGLGSFLLGHVCYIVAFIQHGVHPLSTLAGVLIVAGVASLALPQVLRGAHRTAGPQLTGVVAGYAAALAAMSVLAVGTSKVVTAVGGVAFLASDCVLAFERFVRPVPRGKLTVIVTYHVAQLLIVIGLIRHF